MSAAAGGGGHCSLRARQTAALKRMLNLNVAPSGSAVAAEPVWKVLVYDQYCSDIISPLLTVKELRSLGVTLHMLIDSEREQIPDAVAVYFVVPSQENIARICQDCRSQAYESYYFNFITPLPRDGLEELARTAVEARCEAQVVRVVDQYINFISLEEELFIVRNQNTQDISYYALNRPDAMDTDIKMVTDPMVESLFSVFASTGCIPIIRCPRGEAAHKVAEGLDKRLRDNLIDPRNSVFSGDNLPASQLSFSRPLLVILDRNMDLATSLHHTWTYQALVHDVMEFQLNRVTLPAPPPSEVGGAEALLPGNQEKTYDLLPTDKFWQTHRGSPFPTVADAVQAEVNDYKTSEEEVMRLKTVMGVSEDDDPDVISGALTDNTAKLTSAISSLPELLDKKKRIDMHTNIATALLEHIKQRKLDLFFEMEDKMITKSSLDKSVLDIISDPEAGTPEDKMRLFIIYYILSPDVSEPELAKHSTALEEAGADTSPLTFLKRWKAYAKMTANPRAQKLGGSGASGSSMSTMFSQWVSSGSKFVVEGVKNLVVGTKNLPVTRIVEQLMELKNSKDTEDYLYFDPKMIRITESSLIPRTKTPFQEVNWVIIT